MAEVREPATGVWRKVGPVFLDNGSTNQHADAPFSTRSYALFGFLANVRNYSECEAISAPRGLPVDLSGEGGDWVVRDPEDHSHSWLTLHELLSFDYDRVFTDVRDRKPRVVSYRQFLGVGYFDVLAQLKTLGKPEDVRVIFYFNG